MNTTTKHIDAAGNERELELVGTCKDGTSIFREVGSTGVVGDNADGIRLFADVSEYVMSLPESDRDEVLRIFSK